MAADPFEILLSLGSGLATGAAKRKRENELLQLEQKERNIQRRESNINRVTDLTLRLGELGVIDQETLISTFPLIRQMALEDPIEALRGIETQPGFRERELQLRSRPKPTKKPTLSAIATLSKQFDKTDPETQKQLNSALQGKGFDFIKAKPLPVGITRNQDKQVVAILTKIKTKKSISRGELSSALGALNTEKNAINTRLIRLANEQGLELFFDESGNPQFNETPQSGEAQTEIEILNQRLQTVLDNITEINDFAVRGEQPQGTKKKPGDERLNKFLDKLEIKL